MALKVYFGLFGYGGIEPPAHDATFGEFTHPKNGDIEWIHKLVYDDALISRSRSIVASRAIHAKADVLFMVDHDIQWAPGDLADMARIAKKENALVGGLYSCRSMKRGFSSRLETQGVKWVSGGKALHPAEYVATGFLAIPVRCLERILAVCSREDAPDNMRVRECTPMTEGDIPWYDFFRCITVPSTMEGFEGKYEYASEDWSLCARAKFAEIPMYVWERPRLVHWGRHGFTVDDGLRDNKST